MNNIGIVVKKLFQNKNIVTILVITAILGILCLGFTIIQGIVYVVSDDLVSLTVKEGSLTKSKATLILENHTDKAYTYGGAYLIEKYKFGAWYRLIPKRELNFTLIAYELKAKEIVEIEIDWEYGYGELKPGKYRIIKSVSDFLVAAEFIIK